MISRMRAFVFCLALLVCLTLNMLSKSAFADFSIKSLDVLILSQTPLSQPVNLSSAQLSKSENFISDMADKGIAFLGSEDLTLQQKKAEFKTLLNAKFDLDTIGRFALGRYWRTASKAEKSEYLKLFKQMVFKVYANRFEEYGGQSLKVLGSRVEGRSDSIVSSVLTQNAGPDIKIDWRVRYKNGSYKIIDVVIEGVSMALTQRSDFSSVIQRGGGNVSVLINHLSEKY